MNTVHPCMQGRYLRTASLTECPSSDPGRSRCLPRSSAWTRSISFICFRIASSCRGRCVFTACHLRNAHVSLPAQDRMGQCEELGGRRRWQGPARVIMLSKHLQAWVSASGCGVVAAMLACLPLQNWVGRAVDGDTVAARAGVGAGARDSQRQDGIQHNTQYTWTRTRTHRNQTEGQTERDRDRDTAIAVTNTA